MIDTTLVAFAYVVFAVATVAVVAALAGLTLVLRDLRSTSTGASALAVAGPSARGFSRAA